MLLDEVLADHCRRARHAPAVRPAVDGRMGERAATRGDGRAGAAADALLGATSRRTSASASRGDAGGGARQARWRTCSRCRSSSRRALVNIDLSELTHRDVSRSRRSRSSPRSRRSRSSTPSTCSTRARSATRSRRRRGLDFLDAVGEAAEEIGQHEAASDDGVTGAEITIAGPRPLRGTVRVPGDKGISTAPCCRGPRRRPHPIRGLADGDDVQRTAARSSSSAFG